MLITIIIGIMVFAIVLANMLEDDAAIFGELEQRIERLENAVDEFGEPVCVICGQENEELAHGLCELCATRQRLMSLHVRAV